MTKLITHLIQCDATSFCFKQMYHFFFVCVEFCFNKVIFSLEYIADKRVGDVQYTY